MRKYVVYCHTNRINGKKYVGITSQKPERRWQNGHGYCGNLHFYNAIKKYGWEEFSHEILFTDLTKEEAELKEIEIIAKWNLTDAEKGYNKSLGGNILPELSEESRKKISFSLKEVYKKQKHPCYGRKMSQKCAELLSSANNKRKQSVLQYTLNGVLVAEYDSLREMERLSGCHRSAVKANLMGKSKQSYGFVWKYKEENKDGND